ncbi:hypothetical protein V866_008291 [Kwoniella sp. B9012]|uniref:Uncharacterized protein n=1 Tax=Kwoniella europaea PYCC6329 TaxID=1423913 RepID=A0AAX4KVF8_9TREE
MSEPVNDDSTAKTEESGWLSVTDTRTSTISDLDGPSVGFEDPAITFTQALGDSKYSNMVNMLRDNSHRIHFATQMRETFEKLYTENQTVFDRENINKEAFDKYTCNSVKFDDWQTRAQFQTQFALLREADRLKPVEFTFTPRFNVKSKEVAFDAHVKSGNKIRVIEM